jgi:hypothetical protein
MFGKKISFYECKDYFITTARSLNFTEIENSQNCFSVKAMKGSRTITITISSYRRNKVSVDILDSFGLIRIPKEDFFKMEEFRTFIVNSCNQILLELKK